METRAPWASPAVAVQYLLPQHLLTRLARRIARCTWRPLKNRLIDAFIRRYGVDMAEAEQPDPRAYPHFNAFFTRALRSGVRTVDAAPDTLACPVDGAVSEIGKITEGRIIQAKGRRFTVSALLGSDRDSVPFQNGRFVTLYLAPRNYHRVHAPAATRVTAMRCIPGRLFSVNTATAQRVQSLFARNERVVFSLETERGPLILCMVGAMLVAGIETVWHGPVTPARDGSVTDYDYGEAGPEFAKGAEMARFNMGSTVILLLPPGAIEWEPALEPGSAVQLGQRLGRYT